MNSSELFRHVKHRGPCKINGPLHRLRWSQQTQLVSPFQMNQTRERRCPLVLLSDLLNIFRSPRSAWPRTFRTFAVNGLHRPRLFQLQKPDPRQKKPDARHHAIVDSSTSSSRFRHVLRIHATTLVSCRTQFPLPAAPLVITRHAAAPAAAAAVASAANMGSSRTLRLC